MVDLDVEAHLFEGQHHGGADVVQRVDRRHREVAALHTRPMAFVAGVEAATGAPVRLFGVDFHEAAGQAGVPTHIIENEKFRLRPEERGVGDAGGFEVSLGAARHRARVALIALHGVRFQHVAGDVQRHLVGERIEHGGGRVRHEHHVGLVDAFPAGDRRAVEHHAAFEKFVVHVRRGDGDVLLLAPGIGEPQIEELDVLFADSFEHIRR